MAKSNLENLVPALDLCKRLLGETFNHSALVWVRRFVEEDAEWHVVPRAQLDSMTYVEWFNAPTLEEIIVAMAAFINFDALSIKRPSRYSGDNLATAALKRWFDESGDHHA